MVRDEPEIDKKSIDRGLLDEVWQFAYMLVTVRRRCLPMTITTSNRRQQTNKEQGEETR